MILFTTRCLCLRLAHRFSLFFNGMATAGKVGSGGTRLQDRRRQQLPSRIGPFDFSQQIDRLSRPLSHPEPYEAPNLPITHSIYTYTAALGREDETTLLQSKFPSGRTGACERRACASDDCTTSRLFAHSNVTLHATDLERRLFCDHCAKQPHSHQV